MAITMHTKSDSEVTCSVDGGASSPPRSPRRPLYYVQSPSNHDVEKMSYGSSPMGSPQHHYYHCSPIHHSRESTNRFSSAPLKNPRQHNNHHHLNHQLSAWKKLQREQDTDDEEYDGDGDDNGGSRHGVRLYVCFVLLFVLMFTLFSLILWGASKCYRPEVVVKNMVFENFNIQAGNDQTGVPTDMLSLNSTVRILYRNPATFFGVHVTATPLELYYYQRKVASGQMEKFYQPRKSQRAIVTVVAGYQVPLYGGVSVLGDTREHLHNVAVPMNLTFVMRSRAYILGKLVRSKFYTKIRCPVTLRGNKLGQRLNMANLCVYR